VTFLLLAFCSFLGWLVGNAAGSYLAAAFTAVLAHTLFCVYIVIARGQS
jgi:hypothetical protein